MALLPASAFPLKTVTNNICASNGNKVRLCGVNWEGAHQDGRVPGGLDKLPRAEIIARIKSWKMNTVRFPFSIGMINNKNGTPYNTPVQSWQIAANTDLIINGVPPTPWQLYQRLVDEMTDAGLYVIVNKHLSYPGWCCSDADCNGLWYNDNWPSSLFTNTWIQVATAFAANPMVGFDLHNEPRKATIGGQVLTPSWGDGNTATDFKTVYQNTAGRIRDTVADAGSGITHLIFCEGLNYSGDLTGWLAKPVTGANIVPSMHDYAWYHKKADGTQQTQAEYNAAMDNKGGFLVTNTSFPLWIGEFGQNTDKRAPMTSGWLANFFNYAQMRHLHWCWWSLSAQAVKGTEPTTNKPVTADGDRQGFGLMCGQDWEGSNSELIALLQTIM